MSFSRAGAWVVSMLAALGVAACSGAGTTKPVPVVDPNVFPAEYQLVIARYLRTELREQADYHGALISQPAFKPVGSSTRYVVCLRFNSQSDIKDKVVVFLSGGITQFINSTPAQCGDAQYQPFRELESIGPE